MIFAARTVAESAAKSMNFRCAAWTDDSWPPGWAGTVAPTVLCWHALSRSSMKAGDSPDAVFDRAIGSTLEVGVHRPSMLEV